MKDIVAAPINGSMHHADLGRIAALDLALTSPSAEDGVDASKYVSAGASCVFVDAPSHALPTWRVHV